MAGVPECPECGTENLEPARAWVGGAGTKKPMKVGRYVCSSCGTSYVGWIDPKTGGFRTMAKKTKSA
jgi:transcription elongation factor Elf1